MTADTLPVTIVHDDGQVLAVDKPAGLAVHRSRMVASDDSYLIDRLRQQIGGDLFLVNRLDRATSGLVLLARNREVAAHLGRQLMARQVDKRYLAIVRGWPEDSGSIDYPLTVGGMKGERKPALTHWRRLAQIEVPIAIGRYPQQRYSLLELVPETGRYRQLRRHLHHIHHPIIGDTTLGRGEHNRLFREHFACHRMLLHAWRLALEHPDSGQPLALAAPLDASWHWLLERFGWQPALAAHAASAPTIAP
ncbi:MAG: pseudouridine synthase [Xanthomonadales bacterium]|nr:pseudouridine synthase [Xanthomonadales bacterium]